MKDFVSNFIYTIVCIYIIIIQYAQEKVKLIKSKMYLSANNIDFFIGDV